MTDLFPCPRVDRMPRPPLPCFQRSCQLCNQACWVPEFLNGLPLPPVICQDCIGEIEARL